MTAKKNQSALLAKYYDMYKKNSRSKVFAPLAESYRKLGMLDDALKILKDGIRNHPNYTLGYIVLAHCYYDLEKFDLAYNTLRPIIAQNADNISLQKIFAQSCINLGYLEEALDTYKYLLFMNPREKFFAEQVKKLEDDLMVGHKKLSLDQLIKAPDEKLLPKLTASDDDWVQIDFAQSENKPSAPKLISENTDDEWVMKKPGLDEHPILKTEKIIERDFSDEYYADEFEEEYGEIEEANAQSLVSDAPLISHTLIDLYCAQQYYDKALELLDKIIELNPHDRPTLLKKNQVLELKKLTVSKEVVTEQDGYDELISIIETKVKVKSQKELLVEKKFNDFLNAIKLEALEHR